jgi:transcriptional accessory protein Tex/SPT6
VEIFTVLELAPEVKLTDWAKGIKSKMTEDMWHVTKKIFQTEMVQKVMNFREKLEDKMDTEKREEFLNEKAEIFETKIMPRLDSIPMENEDLRQTIDNLKDQV